MHLDQNEEYLLKYDIFLYLPMHIVIPICIFSAALLQEFVLRNMEQYKNGTISFHVLLLPFSYLTIRIVCIQRLAR